MNALVVGHPGHPGSCERLDVSFCSVLYGSSHSAAECRNPCHPTYFEQNYVSCICFAPCQNLYFFLFSPNGALALGKGAGVGAGERRAATDLLGLGDGDDTRQPVISRLPAQIHLRLAANKSLHLMLVRCPRGDESVGLGVWHGASLGTAEGPRTGLFEPTPLRRMQCSSRGGFGAGQLLRLY